MHLSTQLEGRIIKSSSTNKKNMQIMLFGTLSLCRQSLLAYANAAAYGGAWGTVAKTDGLPLEATISVQGISKDMSTGPLGDFYRPLAPGTYTVTASAYGYKVPRPFRRPRQ
jgi:hypothetical protein